MNESITKRRKIVKRSCIFCRRSHVNCNEQRPCARCIKRNIAHLCRDDPQITVSNGNGMDGSSTVDADDLPSANLTNLLDPQSFVSENMESEFSSLNEFLSMLEEPLLLPSEPPVNNTMINNMDIAMQQQQPTSNVSYPEQPINGDSLALPKIAMSPGQYSQTNASNLQQKPVLIAPPPTAKEQFFLTAADPNTEITPEEKLKSVINAKLEAGLLKPYDYAAGYTRLQAYMKENMSSKSQQRILNPLNSIRPAFKSIARSLNDVDLMLVEEGFERMLLSYDRVFTSMSMPACLWRRTGEIHRANKEFATLVGVTVDDLRDGKLAIYELMSEESAVNLWEKYGSIAFDKRQKAVLTSCSLITHDEQKRRHDCCFSFTIRRDRYNIPICIVGNFIPI